MNPSYNPLEITLLQLIAMALNPTANRKFQVLPDQSWINPGTMRETTG